MRNLIYVCCASAMIIAGCATASDPIDGLAANLNRPSNRRWQDGLTPLLPLPADASTEAIIATEFATSQKACQIVEAREVQIKGSGPALYKAVLVQTEAGGKIALLQYHRGGWEGWEVRLYDAKTFARTGIK